MVPNSKGGCVLMASDCHWIVVSPEPRPNAALRALLWQAAPCRPSLSSVVEGAQSIQVLAVLNRSLEGSDLSLWQAYNAVPVSPQSKRL
jgi:hypothetical protein